MLLSTLMGKKRRTRQEKIILQLKRELAKKEKKLASSSEKNGTRQEAISTKSKPKLPGPNKEKKLGISSFSYDSSLIKKDLLKTFILTLAIISLEFVLYLKLR